MTTALRAICFAGCVLLAGCGKEETKIPTVNPNESNKTADHGKTVPNRGEKGAGKGATTGGPTGGFKQGE